MIPAPAGASVAFPLLEAHGVGASEVPVPRTGRVVLRGAAEG